METEGKSARKGMRRTTDVVLIVIVAMTLPGCITYWLLANYVFLKELEPVQLKARDEQALHSKLKSIGVESQEPDPRAPLKPERHSEIAVKREIAFTERESNHSVPM